MTENIFNLENSNFLKLKKEAEIARKKEVSAVVKEIKKLIKLYELTSSQLGFINDNTKS